MKTDLSTSQTIALLEILRILRDEKNITARKKIYESYIDKKLGKPKLLKKEIRCLIEKLYGDFDEIGYLVKEFEIKDNLFALYSDTIRRVWIVLQHDIQKEQKERKKNDPTSKQFGYFFTQLAIEAKKYRDKNNLKEPGFTDLRHM